MKYLSFLCLVLFANFAVAKAQCEISISSVDNIIEDGTNYCIVNVAVDVQTSVKAISFDLLYPKGLVFVSSEITEKGVGQAKSGAKFVNIWACSDDNNAHKDFNYVSVTSNANTGKDFVDGTKGNFLTFYFENTDNLDGLSIEDFMFNNVAAGGNGRVEITFPIGNIGTNGLSSYSSSQDIVISGADAYYGQLNETDPDNICLELVPVTGAIKANEGVILKGTSGIVYGTSVNSAEAPNTNDLKASVNGVTVGSNVYVLSTKNNNTGFYHFSGTKIPAGKAYVELTTKSQAPIRIISSVTGIENFVSKDNIITNSVDLYGRKAQVGQKGFVIENGNKIIRL